MTHNDLQSQAWAFAALFLAIDSVRALAERGEVRSEAELTLLPSLLTTNAADIADYYGEPHDPLTRGRDAFLRVFNGKNDQQGLRYSAQILHVERRLAKKAALMAVLKERLHAAERQAEHYPVNYDNLIASFAATYQETASKAAGRILISGAPQWLRQPDMVNRIRALLLTGVRAAALWRAYGGNRWQLLFARGNFDEAMHALDFYAQP